jgi:hypothetical protein
LLLAACANHEGRYEPACIAYEGDKVELKDGRFEWHRFTDQREVGEDGNVVKPFPDYPKTGTYTLSDSRMQFSVSDGATVDDRFLVVHAGDRYLLTRKQHNAFTESNDMPECALKLAGTDL